MVRHLAVIGATVLLVGSHVTAVQAGGIQGGLASSHNRETCSPVNKKYASDGWRYGEFQLCVMKQGGNIYSFTVKVAELQEKKWFRWRHKAPQSLTIANAHLVRTSEFGDERRQTSVVGRGRNVEIGSGHGEPHRFVVSSGRNRVTGTVSVVGVWSKPTGVLRSDQLEVEFDSE